MSNHDKDDKITAVDRLIARLLRIAPWLSFFLIALPAPLYFLLRYFTTAEEAGFYMLAALLSFAAGAVAWLMTALFLVLYRRHWEKRLRDRLARDGVTADELSWFLPELTPGERETLKIIENQNLMLADAYRETLAARVTAARVAANARRELLLVEKRINRANLLRGANTATLEQQLRADRARLEHVLQEGSARRAEAEARLQAIEAAASRGTSWTETNLALQRLEATEQHVPLALETAQLEQQLREDIDRELREDDKRAAR